MKARQEPMDVDGLISWQIKIHLKRRQFLQALYKMAYGSTTETIRTIQYYLGKTPKWKDGKKRHIVICGIPRSGTTLLNQMIGACTTNTNKWMKERPSISKDVIQAEKNNPENITINKNPEDIFLIPRIRRVLHNVRFVIMWRDPRETLASTMVNKYWVHPEKYIIRYHTIKQHENDPDVYVTKFKDLVLNPEKIENIFRELGTKVKHPFKDFWKHLEIPEGTFTWYKPRPLDPKTFEKWKKPKHRKRIEKILEEYPELNKIIEDYHKSQKASQQQTQGNA